MSHLRVTFLIFLLKIATSHANLPEFSDTTHELIGYCAPYHGKVCKSYITSPQVWYSNVSFSKRHYLADIIFIIVIHIFR